MPGGSGGLVGIAGIAVGDAFTPTGQILTLGFDQDAVAVRDPAEGGLERPAQRHAQVIEREAVDFHG